MTDIEQGASAIPSANELQAERIRSWLSLGRFLATWSDNAADWLCDRKGADEAIAIAEAADHCFLKAAVLIDAQRIEAGTGQTEGLSGKGFEVDDPTNGSLPNA